MWTRKPVGVAGCVCSAGFMALRFAMLRLTEQSVHCHVTLLRYITLLKYRKRRLAYDIAIVNGTLRW